MNRQLFLRAVACAPLLFTAAPGIAQDFPSKPVRILTPFPAGSGPEASLRLVADKLSKLWGRAVVVENRPGANGFLAIQAFKQADKDGHELIQLDNVHLSAYPHLFKKLPYDPKADFEPLAPLFKAAFFFAVPASSSYRNVGEVIADARKQPGKLNYGSWSIGNPVHLGSALFETLTGTRFEHIVFKETSQLYASLGTGDLAFALGSYGSSGALQRAGRIRYLAVAGPKRLAAYPDLPTMAESGGPASFDVVGWTALASPRGTPKQVTDKLRRDLAKVLTDPEVIQRYATYGYEPFALSPPEFDAFITAESSRFADVIRKVGVSLD